MYEIFKNRSLQVKNKKYHTSEGRQRKYPHGFIALSEQVCEFTSGIFHHVNGRGQLDILAGTKELQGPKGYSGGNIFGTRQSGLP